MKLQQKRPQEKKPKLREMDEARKIKDLEDKIKRLEAIILKLSSRVDYQDRERQRVRSDINYIYGFLRK